MIGNAFRPLRSAAETLYEEGHDCGVICTAIGKAKGAGVCATAPLAARGGRRYPPALGRPPCLIWQQRSLVLNLLALLPFNVAMLFTL